MELVTGVKERRSVRKFEDGPVPREIIEEIVEVARFAPSWKNTQIARFIFIDDKEKIQALASEDCTHNFVYNIKTLQNAPAAVVVTYKQGKSGFEEDGSFSTSKGDGWEMFDAGVAVQTFCLAAHERGLGTVIMGYSNGEAIAKVIGIPEDEKVCVIMPIGYPAVTPKAPPRKDVEELLRFV